MKEKIQAHFEGHWFDFFSKHLQQVKKIGGQEYPALCPFHEDSKPSFSFNNERGTYYCHGCNAKGDWVSFYARTHGLDPRGDFQKVLKAIGKECGIRSEQEERHLIKTYDYVDASGTPVFQVCRFEPKDFRQRRPDGKGKWIWNLKGITPVLYRLPEVLRSQQVLLVEGEKDADALAAVGFCATTSAMGAGKWREHYSEALMGKDVTLIPDNDAPGREHMRKVALSLSGSAKSIRWVDLPHLGEKQDVSDFLELPFLDGAEELRKLIREAEPYAPPKPVDPVIQQSEEPKLDAFTDLGNATRFAKQHLGRIRFCHAFNRWFLWDGKRWRPDESGGVWRLAKQHVLSLIRQAADIPDDKERATFLKEISKLQNERKLAAMVSLARHMEGIPVAPEQLDADFMLFNCESATLDLRTFQDLPHEPRQLITKTAPFTISSTTGCEKWRSHLNLITRGSAALAGFLQRAFGSCLVGGNRDRILFLFWGNGANGKSLTLETIHTILGDYAMKTPAETLLVKRFESIPNDLARLAGARFVYTSEVSDGKKLAEALVKEISGDRFITARFMRGEFFEFPVSFKIFLATNHLPTIRGTEPAIWDRIMLVPFDVRIPEEDRRSREDMIAEFKAEGPSIMKWLLDGCHEWLNEGLKPPPEVLAANADYRSQMDTLGQFVEEECVEGDRLEVLSAVLYTSYAKWAEMNGHDPMTKIAFGKRLKERGYRDGRGTGKGRVWKGVGLLQRNET